MVKYLVGVAKYCNSNIFSFHCDRFDLEKIALIRMERYIHDSMNYVIEFVNFLKI